VGTTFTSVIATLVPGDVCSEMAFLGDSRATAAVIAKDEVEVDVIWADDLRELVSAFPGFGTRFYRSLEPLTSHLRQDTIPNAPH
jgi:CRP-like cAMP-binding protein